MVGKKRFRGGLISHSTSFPVLNVQHAYDGSKLITEDTTNSDLSGADIFRQEHRSSTEAKGNNTKEWNLDPDFEGIREEGEFAEGVVLLSVSGLKVGMGTRSKWP